MATIVEKWTQRCGVCGIGAFVTEWSCGCVEVVREIAPWGCGRCHVYRDLEQQCGKPGRPTEQ